ncbi:hypothetical protein WJX82_003687 [Trebouxia sp. C0006]
MSAAGQRLGPSGTVVTDCLSPVSDPFEQLQCSHLQDTLDTYKGTLEEAGHAQGAQGWLNASFWEPVPEPYAHEALEGLVEEEALGSYVLVEKEDVLDAIGTFVAAYLATVPEAQHMKPAELQQALTSTFRDLRKGHVRKFWEWGRCAYRCIAFSYGAFSVYENPWLVRAVVTALWTAGKVMLDMHLDMAVWDPTTD